MDDKFPDGYVFITDFDIRLGTTSIDVNVDKTELIKCKHCKHCIYDAEYGQLCSVWGYCATKSDGWCYKGEKEE